MLKHYLTIFFIAMLPLIEIRGAMPYAKVYGLPLLISMLIACVGNMLPLPFIYLFARKFLQWGQDKPIIGKSFTFFLNRGEKAGQKLLHSAGRGTYFALFLFVAIPLPGTGAWTGTLAASVLDLDFRKSLIASMLGVICAGIIMYLVSSGLLAGLSLLG